MVPMIFSQNGNTYTVPAGKYAIVNFALENSTVEINGTRAFGLVTGAGMANSGGSINGLPLPAGTTIKVNGGVTGYGIAAGFLYDLA